MDKIQEVTNNLFQANTCASNGRWNCHRISHTTYAHNKPRAKGIQIVLSH